MEHKIDFIDISSEEYRVYEFNNGHRFRIEAPLKLAVAHSGGHRLFDASGTSHYIPKGWIALSWRAKTGQSSE